jgi:hypothetical protein
MCFKLKMLFDKVLNEFKEGFALFDLFFLGFRIKITSIEPFVRLFTDIFYHVA